MIPFGICMAEPEKENSLTIALRHFETAEANLAKLERLWKEIGKAIPDDIVFGSNSEYEDNCRLYETILPNLPKINGWQPLSVPMDLNAIAQSRLDAKEMGEIHILVSVDNAISEPESELRKYRFLLNQKRRELVRETLNSLMNEVDADIRTAQKTPEKESVPTEQWAKLENHIGQIDTLLGSSERPSRWSELHRHLHFAEDGDFHDIVNLDWPAVKKSLTQNMYGENEPIPSGIEDLSALVATKPTGPVPNKLKWDVLTPELFERLIFSLISMEEGYENPQWLTQTNASDRGRDLSATRVIRDSLGGVIRHRVIIQCKHWLTHSVNVEEIATLQAQMKLWEPPRVDVHVIATTGRFTTDAVDLIDKQNLSDQALRIEMWPESHLEMLLAARPSLIAQFGLR